MAVVDNASFDDTLVILKHFSSPLPLPTLRAVAGDFDQKFRADWEVSFLRGYLDEARSQSDGRKR